MRRWNLIGLVVALWLGGGQAPSWGQVTSERDVKITGPRGKTLERTFESTRGPGYLNRTTEITRPSGTFEKSVNIQRSIVGGGARAPLPGIGGGRNVFVERNVFVGPRWGGGGGGGLGWAPAVLGGVGLFGLGMAAGNALSAPRPAYVVPPPVVVAPAPPVIYNGPPPLVVAPTPPVVVTPPPPPAVDLVAQAASRLQSHHDHSRRDGAITLGRLHDPRAVPVLLDHLKNDTSHEVRVACAVSLGEIGDPRALNFLEKTVVFDKKQDVRDAAAQALARIPRQTGPPPGATAAAPLQAQQRPPVQPPIGNENVPPPPAPEPGFPNN